MEIFDKKFVYFMWDDELEGKMCFVASEIDDLVRAVNENIKGHKYKVHKSNDPSWPFQAESDCESSAFAYYDPNYEVKKAFNEGKEIQFKDDVIEEWRPAYNPRWDLNIEYRVKPKEEKWIVFLARYGDGFTLFLCDESYWETAKKFDGAKTKLFIGSKDEAKEWCKSREKFAEIIKAWEDGKEIQVKAFTGLWYSASNPTWEVDTEYRVKPEEKEETKDKDKMNPIQGKKMCRYNLNLGDWDELKEMAIKMFKGIATLNERFAKKISEGEFVTQDDWKEMNGLWQTFNYINDDKKFRKEDLHHLFTDDLDEEFVEIKAEKAKEEKDKKPECPCEDGIDPKACVGCEHSEDGKPHTFENYHCYICDKSDKKYRPYINSVEMIADFIARFKADCPPYEEPSIWVKNKVTDARHLVTSFVPCSDDDGWYVVLFDYTCDLDELFNEYTYLDGTLCGMEVKE